MMAFGAGLLPSRASSVHRERQVTPGRSRGSLTLGFPLRRYSGFGLALVGATLGSASPQRVPPPSDWLSVLQELPMRPLADPVNCLLVATVHVHSAGAD